MNFNTINTQGSFINLRTLNILDAETTLMWRKSARAGLLNKGAENIEQQKKWIESRPESELNFIIELKNSTPVGMLSLINIDLVSKKAETARFLIGNEDAVKGIPAAVEAMKLIYELAFGVLGLHRLYGTVVSNNTLMAKWQRYLGMKEEGRLREHYFIGGQFRDAIIFGLLEDEYRLISLPKINALIAVAKKNSTIKK